MTVAVFYYSQTGQAMDVAKNICNPIDNVVYKQIIPIKHYPYPWSKYDFFDVFPETRLGMPPSGIMSIDYSDITDAELIIIVGQSWFLSPSLPIQSFLSDKTVKDFLSGKKVVFVNACRNMWLMTKRKLVRELNDMDAQLVGHIVLQDKTPNLISILTIIRWLMYGKKEKTMFLPRAGISENDVICSSKFGEIMNQTIKTKDYSSLQDKLLQAGAIDYKPSILMIEEVGHRMFGLWAKFIRRKGDMGDVRRHKRLNFFYYYLLFVLFFISPIAQALFYISYPFRKITLKKDLDTRNLCQIYNV